jgi:hypothetical protein
MRSVRSWKLSNVRKGWVTKVNFLNSSVKEGRKEREAIGPGYIL